VRRAAGTTSYLTIRDSPINLVTDRTVALNLSPVPPEKLVCPIIFPTGGYVTCYTTSLYLIVFKCVSSSGEAQPSG
jgi:hypothetical protein